MVEKLRVGPIAALILVTVFSCAQEKPEPIVVVRTVEVAVPVPVPVKIDPRLLEWPVSELDVPEFVPPSHPDATSALTPEGEKKLRTLLILLKASFVKLREAVKEDTK